MVPMIRDVGFFTSCLNVTVFDAVFPARSVMLNVRLRKEEMFSKYDNVEIFMVIVCHAVVPFSPVQTAEEVALLADVIHGVLQGCRSRISPAAQYHYPSLGW